jgi:hypothetical protein
MTSMTPPQHEQSRLTDTWPWNERRIRNLTLCNDLEDCSSSSSKRQTNYPEGIGAAILDLIEKALAEQEEKEHAHKLGVHDRMARRRYMKDKREYLDDGEFWK